MATIRSLTDPWYHGFIEQIISRIPEGASPDAFTNALATLNAAAMIANAIDTALGHTAAEQGSGSVVEALDRLRSDLNEAVREALDRLRSDLNEAVNR